MGKREQEILKNAKYGRTIASKGIQEVEVKYKGVKYILNNNSGKYSRVFEDKHAGQNPVAEQKMAYYDSFGGLILLAESRVKVPTGHFWPPYKKKLKNRERLKNFFQKVKEFTSHPVVAPFIIAVIVAILLYLSGIDIRNFI